MGTRLQHQLWVNVVLATVFYTTICASQCIDDFSPCVCNTSDSELVVTCNGISGMEIRNAFSRAFNTTSILRIEILLPSDCGFLPADILSGKLTNIIKIYGIDSFNCDLIIDSNAFTSSANYTRGLILDNLNLRYMDLAFLRDFTVMENIFITRSSNLRALENVRSLLSSIAIFQCYNCTGLANIREFSAGRFLSRLWLFYWLDGDMDDAAANVILGSIAESSAVNTLQSISFMNNSLTQMPGPISNFHHLRYLHLGNNPLKVLKTGSFLFHYRAPDQIKLDFNGIEAIEPAAFVGDYRFTELDLISNNNVNRFPANAFLQILEDMHHRGNGSVYPPRPIICDCELAWLMRDHRHLLANVKSGYCEDGTPFEDHQPIDFAAC